MLNILISFAIGIAVMVIAIGWWKRQIEKSEKEITEKGKMDV